MVMTALAWNLKAWWALTLPEEPGRWQGRHRREKAWALRLEFKTFVAAFVRVPCQVVRRDVVWYIGCCRGTRISGSSSGWRRRCVAEGARNEVGVRMLRYR
jgi:hypothetical protein